MWLMFAVAILGAVVVVVLVTFVNCLCVFVVVVAFVPVV